MQQVSSLQDEVCAMKLTWRSAHTALTEDLRELFARFTEAAPLQLETQIKELRDGLMSEVAHRKKVEDALSGKFKAFDNLIATMASVPKRESSDDRVSMDLTGESGLVLRDEDGCILEVSQDSVAQRHGVQAGWQVIGIDDEAFTKQTLDAKAASAAQARL